MLRILLSALALAMCSFMGCTSNSTITDSDSAETETTTQAGKDAAADDITAGKLVLLSQNLPSPPGHNEYTKLLTDRCGFSFKMVAGKLTHADNAYNGAMMAEARRKYGNDIFSQLKAKRRQTSSKACKACRKSARDGAAMRLESVEENGAS